MRTAGKVILPVILLILSLSLLVFGLSKGQESEVELNGNILCLSCIGIE